MSSIGTSVSGFFSKLGNLGTQAFEAVGGLTGISDLASTGLGIYSTISGANKGQPGSASMAAVAQQQQQQAARTTGALALPGGAPNLYAQQAGIGGDLLQWGVDAIEGVTSPLAKGVWDWATGGSDVNGALTINPVQRAGRRWPSIVQGMVTTPSGNTRVITYKNMGSPVLYSGDLAACRRVKRVARKVRGAAGGR